jgi:hypothetical protein
VAYASVADVTAALSEDLETPSTTEVTRLIARASEAVDGLLMQAIYTVDAYGAPTDTVVTGWIKKAVVAQVTYWIETGDDQGAAASVTGAGAGGGGAYFSGGIPRMSPHAVMLLRQAVDSSSMSIFAYAPLV